MRNKFAYMKYNCVSLQYNCFTNVSKKMETEKKIKVIGIKGLQKFFNCSRVTIYSKYLSRLDRVPSVDNRALFSYESALKIKQEDENKKQQFEEIM